MPIPYLETRRIRKRNIDRDDLGLTRLYRLMEYRFVLLGGVGACRIDERSSGPEQLQGAVQKHLLEPLQAVTDLWVFG